MSAQFDPEHVDPVAALRLGELIAKTPPLPPPVATNGADWCFMVSTLDNAARWVGPLARDLLKLQEALRRAGIAPGDGETWTHAVDRVGRELRHYRRNR